MVRLITILISILMLVSTTLMAQWENVGGTYAFSEDQPDTLRGMIHGIAVDPDGKIWVQMWGTTSTEVAPGDTVSGFYPIYVFNPDGSQTDFSPIFQITSGGGFIVDTLYASVIGNPRGLRADNDGNILAVWGSGQMFRINYQTGEGMNKVETGMSPTAPAVDADGRIYVAPVLTGGQIQIYNSDFTFVGNAVEETTGFARTVMVSGDGNTIYHCGFTNGYITVYERPNPFSGYDSVGTILDGFHAESAAWDPKSGLFWASAGSFNDNAELGWTNNTWYGYDLANDAVVDSFKWVFNVQSDGGERPRAIDFAPDGNTVYYGIFGTGGHPLLQKSIRDLTPVDVTFNADMSIQILEGNFDPASGSMTLAGSFNNWNTTNLVMTDPDGDEVYSVTVTGLEPGTRVYYKYLMNGQWEEGLDFPSPNGDREHVVTAGNNSTTAFFNDYLGSGIEVQFNFSCNMEVEIAKGAFVPGSDELSVRGSFNEYGTSDVLAVTDNPNIYELNLTIKVFAGDVLEYKFGYGDTEEKMYTYTVKQEDVTSAYVEIARAFNSIPFAEVTEMETTVAFQVDMRGAVNDVTGEEFEAIENVVLAGKAAPLQWPSAGWPDSDQGMVLFLNDDGLDGDLFVNDSVWGTTVTFPAYTYMKFEYKYGANWGLASNGGSNDNEASTGVLHTMDLSKDIMSAVAFDTWADMSPTNLDSVISDVKEIASPVPSLYTLDQNYPNPFNPTTNIRFAIPTSDIVAIRVYDMLGQEVATLLNEYKSAGTYEVKFDASNLSSGIYVYAVSSGKFLATRKMMLLK